jgi:hypothetical protein
MEEILGCQRRVEFLGTGVLKKSVLDGIKLVNLSRREGSNE